MIDNFFNLKFNQKEYAEYLLEHGYNMNRRNRFAALKVLYLYAKDVLGYSKQQRLDFLKEFILKYNPSLNEIMVSKLVERVENFRNNTSVTINDIHGIPIYKREVNFINKNIVTLPHQKILFALLCIYKFQVAGGFGSGGYLPKEVVNLKNLGSLSNVIANGKRERLFEIVLELCGLGYMRISRDGSFFLNFISKINYQDDDEVVYWLTDYGEFGLYWRLINKDQKVALCQNCGTVFAYHSKLNSVESYHYCRRCSQELKLSSLLRRCTECGNIFMVSSIRSGINQCPSCRKK